MCLILLGWHAHAGYPLIFAGNRDEAYNRPSTAADFWRDEPRLFGGRDLEKGGTWLGITIAGRFAAVTNYRDGHATKDAPRSRGELASNYLRGADDPRSYMEWVMSSAQRYAGFSLIAGDLGRLFFCSNRSAGVEEIPPGVHGLSNHLLNTPWPKVTRCKQRMTELRGADKTELIRELFNLLGDRSVAPDAELPDTGIGLQRERELSPVFVTGDGYGTRASTVLLVDRDDEVTFIERVFGQQGAPLETTARRFMLAPHEKASDTLRAG